MDNDVYTPKPGKWGDEDISRICQSVGFAAKRIGIATVELVTRLQDAGLYEVLEALFIVEQYALDLNEKNWQEKRAKILAQLEPSASRVFSIKDFFDSADDGK